MFSSVYSAATLCALLLASPALATRVVDAAAAITTGVVYTAKYDDLKSSTGIPSPYKGLYYNSWSLAQAQAHLSPQSSPNFIGTGNILGNNSISTGPAHDFVALESLYLACYSCSDNFCNQVYPESCDVTVFALKQVFPASALQSAVLQYRPNITAENQGNTHLMQKFSNPANHELGLVYGATFTFVLTSGQEGTTIFIDNLAYEFLDPNRSKKL